MPQLPLASCGKRQAATRASHLHRAGLPRRLARDRRPLLLGALYRQRQRGQHIRKGLACVTRKNRMGLIERTPSTRDSPLHLRRAL